MNQLQIILQKLTQIINWQNLVTSNSKTTEELPVQDTLVPTSLVRVSKDGESESLVVQQIIDAARSGINGLSPWGPGTFDVQTGVIQNDKIYIIASGTSLPFASVDFNAELAAGYWILPTVPSTVEIVESPNTVVFDLGNVTDLLTDNDFVDYINTNGDQYDMTDTDKTYYFRFVNNGIDYLYSYNSDAGDFLIYGAGSGNTMLIGYLNLFFNSTYGGSVDQDNIPKLKSIGTVTSADLAVFATKLNALPSFEIGEKEIFNFVAYLVPEGGDHVIPTQYKFRLRNLGKGTYGTGGTATVASNIEMIYVSQPSLSEIMEESPQVVELGEIGGTLVSDSLNGQDPPITIQEQSEGFVVVRTLVDDVEVMYLFLGVGGDYGVDNYQSTEADFLPLNDVPSDPYVIPTMEQTWQRSVIVGGGFPATINDNPMALRSSTPSSSFAFMGNTGFSATSDDGEKNYAVRGSGFVHERASFAARIFFEALPNDSVFFRHFMVPSLEITSNNDIRIFATREWVSEQGFGGSQSLSGALDIGNQMNQNIDADGNQIENLANASAPQQAATLNQVDAAEASAKAYADALVVGVYRPVGDWNASVGTFPAAGSGSGSGGAIRRGDTYNTSVSGTMGGKFYDVNDKFYANVNTPGQTAGNWSKFEGNTDQGTETERGTWAAGTQTEIEDQNTTDDSKVVTLKKFWLGLAKFRSLAWSWTLKQTFLTAPRLDTVTASKMLKVNATKDIVEAVPNVDYMQAATGSAVSTSILNGSYVWTDFTTAVRNGNMGTASPVNLRHDGTVLLNAILNRLQGQLDALSAYTAKTAAYTATTLDYMIDCTSGTFTVTLPNTYVAQTPPKEFLIKNSGTGTITIIVNGGTLLIDGVTSKVLSTQYSFIRVKWDGTNYKVTG